VTTLPRTLPLGIKPVPGESFASLVERLAVANQVPIPAVFAATGIVDVLTYEARVVGYGLVMHCDRLQVFAHAARLPESAVEASLLSRYDGVAVDVGDADPAAPASIARVCTREWLYYADSHICPRCIAERPAWLVRWKLPWSFACTRHQVLLASSCPGCGIRMGGRRREAAAAPISSAIPVPGYCHNSPPLGTPVRSQDSRACRFPLALCAVDRVDAYPQILDSQMFIDRLLDEPTNPRVLAKFARLRSLMALLMAVASRGDLGPLPPSAEEAWLKFEKDRNEIVAERTRLAAAGMGGKNAPRTRFWSRAPRSSELVSALATRAIEMSGLTTPNFDPVSALEPIFRSARDRRPRDFWAVEQWFPFPQDLADGWRILSHRASRRRVMRALAHETVVSRQHDFGFDARHVPLLLQKDLWEPRLRSLCIGLSESTSRTYASLCVVRLTVRTWADAAGALDIERRRASTVLGNGQRKLTRANTSGEFWEEILLIAGSYTNRALVDYRAREEALTNLVLLPAGAWTSIRAKGGVTAGIGDSRRRNATAWLWSELTGREGHEAPAFGFNAARNEREVFRRFKEQLLPTLREPLLAYGRELTLSLGI
jgi:hypothetical protein